MCRPLENELENQIVHLLVLIIAYIKVYLQHLKLYLSILYAISSESYKNPILIFRRMGLCMIKQDSFHASCFL